MQIKAKSSGKLCLVRDGPTTVTLKAQGPNDRAILKRLMDSLVTVNPRLGADSDPVPKAGK